MARGPLMPSPLLLLSPRLMLMPTTDTTDTLLPTADTSTTMNPRSSLFASMVVLALLSCVQKTDSTFAITATTAAGATVLSLTAAQVTGIAALGVLVKAKALLAVALIARSRGRRSVGPSTLSLEGLVSLESEHCYKRSFCYAATGKEEKMTPLLVLLDSCNAASSPKAVKFCEAAGLGQKFRSLEKCELRYKCSLGRDFIQDMFNQ